MLTGKAACPGARERAAARRRFAKRSHLSVPSGGTVGGFLHYFTGSSEQPSGQEYLPYFIP